MSKYHHDTAYVRGQMSGHMLDWSQQPDPFKRYRHRQPTALPSPRPPKAGFFSLARFWPPRARPPAGSAGRR